MNPSVKRAWLILVGLLLAAGHAHSAAPTNPQVVYTFCGFVECTPDQLATGYSPNILVAGPGGVYYGITSKSGTMPLSAGGSLYRYEPVTRSVQALYHFQNGYRPAAWLKVGPDGSLYGGYVRSEPATGAWISEGHFRLTPGGQFTIDRDENQFKGFADSVPVQDSLGNLIGIVTDNSLTQPAFAYSINLDGTFEVLHKFLAGWYSTQEPVLAADGNLYATAQTSWQAGVYIAGAVWRIAPDGSVATAHSFPSDTEGTPTTPIIVGPDGALYGVMFQLDSSGNGVSKLYRLSLSGDFTEMGDLGPANLVISTKLTLMPDGNFYGTVDRYVGRDYRVLFRISPNGGYTELFQLPQESNLVGFSPLIQGFGNAMYGAIKQGGPQGAGLLYRYALPAAPSSGSKRKH